MNGQVFNYNVHINFDKLNNYLFELQAKYGYGNIPIQEAMGFELDDILEWEADWSLTLIV